MIKDYTIIPNKRLPRGFHNAMRHIMRPYIPITKDQYDEIMRETAELNSDIIKHKSGMLYTFGNADGGYALMPYIEFYIRRD